ncbi:hypothetical protein Ddye_019527 [Dipteronia dyeriana]|uniref:Gnk2-homologous domain-containing protein n=1 Tax=Dipteronia dyeriana TaxID=168575 RepID=A0AAD9TY80_9ROSI|nr:hypothetical protein Ddye_019527 [Dipteronia dyeriana]
MISSITCQSYNYHFCSSPPNDTAAINNYISKLDSVLNSLPSKASVNSFYNESSDGVYILFLCRGDVSAATCQTCVKNATQAWQLWNEGKGLELIDSKIVDNCPISEVLRWIHIAFLCVQDDPATRPTMSQVVLMLGSQAIDLPSPSTAPYSVGRYTTMSDQSTFGTGIGILTSDQITVEMDSQ